MWLAIEFHVISLVIRSNWGFSLTFEQSASGRSFEGQESKDCIGPNLHREQTPRTQRRKTRVPDSRALAGVTARGAAFADLERAENDEILHRGHRGTESAEYTRG